MKRAAALKTPEPVADEALAERRDPERASAPGGLAQDIAAVALATGQSPMSLIQSYVRLAMGPGKIGFKDYVKLRLFDPSFHESGELERFVGARRNRELCAKINYRHDWIAVLNDKIAASGYLQAWGLPCAPTAAIYAANIGRPGPERSCDPAGLKRFLTKAATYPLFGKPVDGAQSLGALALEGYDAGSGQLRLTGGELRHLDEVVSQITTDYPHGYLFQPLLRPHPQVKAVCGPRLATVRLVTLLRDGGAEVFRAAWKIPSGENIADNFWRSGNILADIDVTSGEVRRAVCGAGLEARLCGVHPDTGAGLVGFHHPQWREMCELALEGARLMRHMPLVGWDIALTDQGAMIIEMNEAPDLFLVQFAAGRGALDERFNAFVARQEQESRDFAAKVKAELSKL